MPKLSIIIVNWNSGTYLKECVDSILASEELAIDDIEIIIVDNASNDNSIEFAYALSNVNVIRNIENVGFAKACNIGVNNAKAEFILLLNPDTKVLPDTLNLSLEFLKSHSEYSVLGIKQINEKGDIQKGCCYIPTFSTSFNAFTGLNKISNSIFPSFKMIDWAHNEDREVGHVIGSFYLLKKTVWQSVDGMDESYFLYYEDLDLSVRLTYSQKKIFYWTGAEISHAGGGTSEQIKAQRLYYSVQSRLIFVRKHFSGIKKILLVFTLYFIEPIIRLSISLIKFKKKTFSETWRAYSKLYC